jgi:hypothetical protein
MLATIYQTARRFILDECSLESDKAPTDSYGINKEFQDSVQDSKARRLQMPFLAMKVSAITVRHFLALNTKVSKWSLGRLSRRRGDMHETERQQFGREATQNGR